MWEILKADGVDPAPQRATVRWADFLRSQAEAILAMDSSPLPGSGSTSSLPSATVRSGVRMPRMNAIMERWVNTLRAELLDRTLIWNETHLRHALREYKRHYNQHRTHRSPATAAPLRTRPDRTPRDTPAGPTRGSPPRVQTRRLTCMDVISAPAGPGTRPERVPSPLWPASWAGQFPAGTVPAWSVTAVRTEL